MNNYFTDDELKCRCCGVLIIDRDFREKLNIARFFAGFPFILDSGYRCPKHNKDEGSTSTNHTSGKAADIKCTNDRERYKMLIALIGAGMLGLGLGKNFIHADTNRTAPAIWTY